MVGKLGPGRPEVRPASCVYMIQEPGGVRKGNHPIFNKYMSIFNLSNLPSIVQAAPKRADRGKRQFSFFSFSFSCKKPFDIIFPTAENCNCFGWNPAAQQLVAPVSAFRTFDGMMIWDIVFQRCFEIDFSNQKDFCFVQKTFSF